MNEFSRISQDFEMGFITPIQFVELWNTALSNVGLNYSSDLETKIKAIMDEANEKMRDVVKEISEHQAFLKKI